MDFITLDRALDDIGCAIKFPEHLEERYPLLGDIYQTSEAAADLHQQLHNYPELRPKWVILHFVTQRPVFDDTFADAGMEMLLAKAGRFLRLIGAERSEPSLAITNKKFPIPPPEAWTHGRKHSVKSPVYEIGFDRIELIRFLDDPRVGIDHHIRLPGGRVNEQGKWILPEHLQQHDGVRTANGRSESTGAVEAPIKRSTVPKLALPDKSDTWAKAIAATYELMAEDLARTPSGAEVWLRMNDRPPLNYPIKVTKDHGLSAIMMHGEKPLTRDAFLKRWARYTGVK